jgi:hypothetical protein
MQTITRKQKRLGKKNVEKYEFNVFKDKKNMKKLLTKMI